MCCAPTGSSAPPTDFIADDTTRQPSSVPKSSRVKFVKIAWSESQPASEPPGR
jgi:hypothetical protein